MIHKYETDDGSLATNENLIERTPDNNDSISISVNQAARTMVKDGNYDQDSLSKVEFPIRAYDPCLSCATH